MQTVATGAPDCLCRREAASRRATRPDGAALVAALMRVVTASALVACEPAPPCWGRRECCTLLVCVSTRAAPPRGSYSAEANGDIDACTSACGTFARAAHWALARDRYAGAPDCLRRGRQLLATWTRTMMSEARPTAFAARRRPVISLCVFSPASLRDDGSRLGHFVYLASVFRLPHAQRWGLLPCLARESVGHGLLVEALLHARRSPGSICALVH